mmetsp:Transcript_70912/g.167172  ORF Transcript_70912/g.167172 Transcript_70912/m.167172 type:complete len:142 (+) Transcript_70912:1-426(+)
MIDYNHRLVLNAASELANLWGTEVLHAPEHTGTMALVRVPGDHVGSSTKAAMLTVFLQRRHNITCYCMPLETKSGLQLWIRIAAQVFNDVSDYLALGEVLSEANARSILKTDASQFTGDMSSIKEHVHSMDEMVEGCEQPQ